MDKQKTWKDEDIKREDLNSIPKMEENGFKVVFSNVDIMHGRTTPDKVPHDAVGFSKGELHVWRIYKSTSESITAWWQTAKLIDGRYCDHKPVMTLDELL